MRGLQVQGVLKKKNHKYVGVQAINNSSWRTYVPVT